ncbi:CBS domain-containing protein [Sphaerimonospora mesophila]|uniref:CBS domain-containing protein n=1 Tax=Sphaerimonospora mesophila TaxID=37483 RepID=UPI0006E3BFD2
MRISNVYRPAVYGCQTDERLPQVARQMMEKNVGALAVLEGERVTGVITERDLTDALATCQDPAAVSAASYATTRLRTARLDEDSRDVARRMLDAGVRHMPVEEDGRLVGMVSMRDLLAVETWAS